MILITVRRPPGFTTIIITYINIYRSVGVGYRIANRDSQGGRTSLWPLPWTTCLDEA